MPIVQAVNVRRGTYSRGDELLPSHDDKISSLLLGGRMSDLREKERERESEER